LVDLNVTDACSHTYLQLSRSVQLRNALVQNISPLCSIQGSLDFHESASDVGEAEKHVTYARSEAKRMNLVVSDSLDVHRLEAGEIVISPNAYRVTTLVGEAAKAVQTSHWREKQRKLCRHQSHCRYSFPRLISIAIRIIRVLRNLLSYAIHASPEKSPITINCTVLADQSVRIEIRDTGDQWFPLMRESPCLRSLIRLRTSINLTRLKLD